jgi:23S rRNA pseudouridine2605 synthase
VKERIQKLLARAGVASRRGVEEMVRQGRITVNGKTVSSLPVLADPAEDKIVADGELLKIRQSRQNPHLYVLLNKPKDVYATNVAQGEQRRAIDLLPPDFPQRVYPVGRLEAASTGLLLLTNDGDLTNQLTHPRYGVTKTYRATAAGFVEDNLLAALERAAGFKSGQGSLKIVHRSSSATVLEITASQAPEKQLRQMLAAEGHKLRDLTRTRLGPLTLHGLAVGQARMLTTREIAELKKLGKRSQRSTTDKPRKTPKIASRP